MLPLAQTALELVLVLAQDGVLDGQELREARQRPPAADVGYGWAQG